MTMSNYDSNENADYESSESEDSDVQTHPDITSMISPAFMNIPMKFYCGKYMLKQNDPRPIVKGMAKRRLCETRLGILM